MSLKMSEKEGPIDHLLFNTYNLVQRLWKSVQPILRYFGSEQTSLVQNKIGCHGNVPWDIKNKNFRSIIYTQNAFIWCKNCKNRTWFVFCLRHKIGCHGNVLEESEKLDMIRKFTQIPSIWWKDRENRSTRYWDSFTHSNKKKKRRNYGR